MSGDSLSVVLFFLGVAVSFFVQTLKPDVGKVRIYMLAVAGVMVIAAIVWPFVGALSPAFASSAFAMSVVSLASNASSWFILLMVSLVISSLPHMSAPVLLRKDRGLIPPVTVELPLVPTQEATSPQIAVNRDKLTVLIKEYAQNARNAGLQVVNTLFDRMRNSDDKKDYVLSFFIFNTLLHPDRDPFEVMLSAVRGPEKENLELLEQRFGEFFETYQRNTEMTNYITGHLGTSLQLDREFVHREFVLWQEKHKLFYQKLRELLAGDGLTQLQSLQKKQWTEIFVVH